MHTFLARVSSIYRIYTRAPVIRIPKRQSEVSVLEVYIPYYRKLTLHEIYLSRVNFVER